VRVPAAPADLVPRGRGRRFWGAVHAEFHCSTGETELLAEACRLLDELDALRAAVVKDGATVAGSRGQTRAHPALAELRAGRAELRRLIDALALPPAVVEGEIAGIASLTSRRASKAARVRWAGRGAQHHG
jgi:hypothetical protein